MKTKHTQHKSKSTPALLSDDSPFRDCLLVAMPAMQTDSFARSVIYLCAHSKAGAMGIVINQRVPEIVFKDLLEQLNLPHSELRIDPVIHFGGPVETGRGFVLHSTDFLQEDTVKVNDNIGITGSIDILRAIARGEGPHKSIFALGYAGWGPGQLDAEMHTNSWLTIPADDDLIFGTDLTGKWEKAILKIGINPFALSSEIGHA